ncbi:uncharacterized protein LOC128859756 [Anastrepha ludens]|uniref:uncharacterized protein LOC128859756 n=1 Tax=Anastrepha ludens TaxID=28586 RepID=UPI0023AFC9FD|nr:uncharacterized protein LOC128859756 [Anastrepha ludens]
MTAAHLAAGTTIKTNKNALKRQEALLKSPTTCSFWPHCGACTANDATRPHVTSKRQMSLQEPQQLPFNCPHTAQGNVPLQRFHSTRAANNLSDSVKRHNSYSSSHNPNISTVSVNTKFNDVANKASGRGSAVETQNNCALTGIARSKTQWTLLCSGATLMDSIDESNTAATPSTIKLAASCPNSSAMVAIRNDTSIANAASMVAVKSTTLPLASTSSIFLGECEMPITRERESLKKSGRGREAKRKEKQPTRREISSIDDNRTIAEMHSKETTFEANIRNLENNSRYEKLPDAIEINSSSMGANRTKTKYGLTAAKVMQTATKTTTSAFTVDAKPLPTKLATSTTTAAERGMPHLRTNDWRSISLPNILLSSHG